jgi:hypothetical protein
MVRDIGEDLMSRTNRLESTRRVDNELSVPTVMDGQRDYSHETHIQEDKRDSQDQFTKESKKVSVNEDEDPLPPHPWIKCKSSRNKDYYFNTQTRESQWNYPEIGRNRQAQNDGKDEDDSRKKIRLNDNGDGIVTNTDVNPQIEHEDKTLNTMPTVKENDTTNKEASLKEEISFDQQSESSSRLPRSNSTFLFSPPMSQAQPSPGMSTVFSSEYNERRFSADYGSPRRGSYVGSQPHSPQMSSRPSPFNRGGSVDLYDRNDGFRNDDFISNRSLGDPRNITSPSGNNNNGLAFPGSPIRLARSGMYNSFDPNTSPGSRRSTSAGVGPTFTQSSMSRVRTVEEERLFHSEQQSMEVEPSANEVHKYEMDITNNSQGYEAEQNVDEESDEDAWRSDNEPIEYGAAETEPVSIFLFRRAGSRMDQSGVKKKFLNSRKEYGVMKAICGGKGMHLFKVIYLIQNCLRIY